MTAGELAALASERGLYRGKAVFELMERARTDAGAADELNKLSRRPDARADRVFHMVSLAWVAIIGLPSAKTRYCRELAYAAFARLDEADQRDLLACLRIDDIRDAHPTI